MLTIPAIATSIRASRAEFGRLFLQAQIDFVSPVDRVHFEAIAQSSEDVQAFTVGLTFAQTKGWLDALIDAIVDAGLDDGKITEAKLRRGAAGPELQAMTNLVAGFDNPELSWRGIASGMRWTVKVVVDAQPKGSGILIGPHLVLTAWHVVATLFAVQSDGSYAPDVAAATKLHVEFDDRLVLVEGGVLSARQPLKVPAHKNWCVVFSACHADELQSKLPADLAQLDGHWDYAVIRLAKTPGTERRWAALDARAVVPRAQATMHLFQHPAGYGLRCSQTGILAPGQTAATAIPRLRFLHSANSTNGSSGGPCFDKSFMLFGLHQGEWLGTTPAKVNRGVPIQRVLEDLRVQIQDLPVPDASDCSVWRLGDADYHAPVIGCDAFQTTIWHAAITGKPRIISVYGEPYSGKSFRLDVLAGILPDGANLKVRISAPESSKRSALEWALAICDAAGARTPAFVSAADFGSTIAAWLRDELVHKCIEALEVARSGRLVWIAISDLNKTDIQGEHASEFLFCLYEQVRSVEWLRILLDGMKADLPASVRQVAVAEEATLPTEEDIMVYLRRAIAELEIPSDDAVLYAGKYAYQAFLKARRKSPATALRGLAEGVLDAVDTYAAAFVGRG